MIRATKHWKELDIYQQMDKVKEEYEEVFSAYESLICSPECLSEELIDLMTACEGALDILQRDYGVDKQKAKYAVLLKNTGRGYL